MIEYREIENVPTDVETTVLSITNTGLEKQIQSFGISGTASAVWTVYANTNLIMQRRTTPIKSSLSIDMYNLRYLSGTILDIKVKHNEPNLQKFQAEVNISG